MNNLKFRVTLILVFIALFGGLTFLTITGSINGFERVIYTGIAKHISPALTGIVTVVTNAGSFAAIAVVCVMLLILPYTRFKFGIPVAMNAIISSVLNIILKSIISRERPDILRLVIETGYGFPSGHSMNNAALYAIISLLAFRYTKNIRIRLTVLMLFIIMTVAIGISRIYLGVHNAGDVISGWIMGMTVALLTDSIWQIIIRKRVNLTKSK